MTVCACLLCAACSVNIDDFASSSSLFIYSYSLSLSFFLSLFLARIHSIICSLTRSSLFSSNIRPSHMHITYIHLHAYTIHFISSENKYTGSVRGGFWHTKEKERERKTCYQANPYTYMQTYTALHRMKKKIVNMHWKEINPMNYKPYMCNLNWEHCIC